MASLRLFIAINLPVEVREALEKVQQTLKAITFPIKWVEPKNMHLTLDFLGEVEEQRITLIKESLQQTAGNFVPFNLCLERVGAFPNLRNPRIIWVGLGGDTAKVYGLQAQIHRALLEQGFVLDNKPFNPHLTLGRVKQSGSRFRPGLENQKNSDLERLAGNVHIFESDAFDIKRGELMQSVLTSKGPIYSELESISFASKISY